MIMPLEHDRIAQILIASDYGLEVDEARAQLEGAQLVVSIDPDAAQMPWGQAALLAIAGTASRMFRGGVHVAGTQSAQVLIGRYFGQPLGRALVRAGCRSGAMPAKAFKLHIGRRAPERVDLYATVAGWRAHVGCDPTAVAGDGNVIAGVLAGALAVTEAFRRVVLGDLLACRRPITLSAWDPASPTADPVLSRLPAALWLIGLGNLGQATMFVLGLLPFPDRADVHVLVQDSDASGEENRLTQILTEPGWISQRKARMIADHAEALGFLVTACERRFAQSTRPEVDEPRVALVGVDNLPARRLAADGRFALALDAGLGRSAEEIFDIRLHGFPGRMTPDRAWPDRSSAGEVHLNPGLERLVEQGRMSRCGALEIAGQSLGVPSTALVASALQVSQLLRALATGSYCDFVDLTLCNIDAAVATSSSLPAGTVLPSLLPNR